MESAIKALYNILISTNETITGQINRMQIAVNLDYSLNYFNRVLKELFKYQLPTLNELKIKQPTNESRKSTVNEAVNKHWTESLKNEAYEKSSLRYLNIDSVKIGEIHPFLSSLDSIVSDGKRVKPSPRKERNYVYKV